ncbi:hypothetical protein SMA5143A_4016 [Streptomyces sp. MA5143a]|nr:hypothetical protein SMA5143A_4016 [Streptomyces sp. MA5143a]
MSRRAGRRPVGDDAGSPMGSLGHRTITPPSDGANRCPLAVVRAGQRSIWRRSLPPLIWILRGLAFSATGMRSVRTPAS